MKSIKRHQIKPSVRLMIHIMSTDMIDRDIGKIINNIQNSPAFAHVAKVRLKEYIDTVRSAKHADPNWTDEQICEMIMEKIDAAVLSQK